MITLEQAATGFSAMGSEPRLAVLKALVRAGPPGLSVGQIQERVGFPASTLAHHLRCLCEGGLITQERQSRSVINRAAFDHIAELAAFLMHECCADSKDDDNKLC